MKRLIIAVLLCVFPLVSTALKPPSVDKVFAFSVQPLNKSTIRAHWDIAPGYHLYREKVSFKIVKPKGVQLDASKVVLPPGIAKQDDILGSYQIYEHQVSVDLPLRDTSVRQVILAAKYQGCADSGFCYPPVTKQVVVNLVGLPQAPPEATVAPSVAPSAPVVASSTQAPPAPQDKASQLLANKNWGLILIGFLGFGVLLAFTPCVLPMVPILSGIIVGQGDKITTTKAFWLSLTYVLAMAVTYATAGIVAGLAGSYVQAILENPWVIAVFSAVFVILAFSLFGFYELRMPQRWHSRMTDLSNRHSGGNYVGVAAMGCLSTLIMSPCVTAPLIGALSYIGKTGDAVLGGSALFTMGLGMGIPLLVIGTVGGKYLPKAGAWMDAVKSIFGVLMLGVAILLLSRVVPSHITMTLWGSLFIASAVYMGAFNTTPTHGWGKLWKGAGVGLLIYGFIVLIGVGLGNTDPFRPLAISHGSLIEKEGSNFKVVKTPAELQVALADAQAKGKHALLDFSADWCVSCKAIERHVFKNEDMQPLLNKFVLIRSDVTANDSSDKAIEKKLGVVAPPTIVFFAPNGNELVADRIVGEIGPKEFSQRLQNVLTRMG